MGKNYDISFQTLIGHNSYVLSVAFSSDGKQIASGSGDKTIKVWDTATGKLQKTLTGHNYYVGSIAFSPDGKQIISGSRDKTIKLWDTATGKLQTTLTGHNGSVLSVAFSPDGKQIASGSADKTIKIWDATTGELQKTLTGHNYYVGSIAFSPDGKQIASGSGDKTIKVWDTATGKLQKTITGHSNSVESVAFSPDGKQIISGSRDKTIKLWDTATGKLQTTLTGHNGSVLSVAFSPDGKQIASGSGDNTIKIWRHKEVAIGNFDNISKNTQNSLDRYLTLPLVPQPKLPAEQELIKSQFETKAEFESRVENERLTREKEIASLQNQYRRDVETRNNKLEKRKQNIEKQRVVETEKSINKLFGKPLLKSLTYDAETKTAYGELYAERGEFNQKISFSIEPQEAESFFENPNASDHAVYFEYGKDGGLYVKDVEIAFTDKQYHASLTDKSYKPDVVKVALNDGKLESLEQNPNLIDRYETKIVEYKGDRKDDLASLVAGMKQSPVDQRKWLFVFAVENYDETDAVIYAKNSAEQFAKAAQKRLGISDRNSYIYIDSKATSLALSDHLDRFLGNVRSGDTVYFYYSGHGIPDPKSGEAFLLPKDKIVDYVTKEESLRASHIYHKLSSSNAGKVVAFVDACFSGKTDNISNYKGVAAGLFKTKKVEFDKSKMTILTAGTDKQFSNAHPDKPHRLFSYYLVETMAKEAKLDLNLLHSKVYTKVKDVSWKMGDVYQQEPTKDGGINLEL